MKSTSDAETVSRPYHQPNIVVLGIGHSGTSILTRMLHTLGWQRGDADDVYSESVSIRDLNEKALTAILDSDLAGNVIAAFGQPWAVKDPRFLHTLHQWLPIFSSWEPLLIWIVRNQAAVLRSYENRGERLRFGLSIEQAMKLGETQYNRWPWMKKKIEYEQLQDAISMFQLSR